MGKQPSMTALRRVVEARLSALGWTKHQLCARPETDFNVNQLYSWLTRGSTGILANSISRLAAALLMQPGDLMIGEADPVPASVMKLPAKMAKEMAAQAAAQAAQTQATTQEQQQ